MPQLQLNLGHDMLWFLSPRILYEHGIDACVVGDAASSIYGSKAVICDLIIAVSDPQLVAAKSILISEGHQERPIGSFMFGQVEIITDDTGSWCNLTPPSRECNVILCPASHYHLTLTRKSMVMILAENGRFSGVMVPSFVTYLQGWWLFFTVHYRLFNELMPYTALISVLYKQMTRKPQLVSSLIRLHFYDMRALLQRWPEQRNGLRPEDKFFVSHITRPLMPRGKCKVLELRGDIMAGRITEEEAMEQASQLATMPCTQIPL
jgi:hypothetical protein